ncbi:MAG: hypothetical protein A3C27_00040 [Candidatus Levybacteria bacterium RIFCSPHIGHO2_02_FULL_39_36]|nr:MAG: hypothetical protein A3C27_00040 [Candidatus Levybacteria bacterium RIFCSPHIGHO2_02_FULL_39_36]OGH48427.1 MAG: hypothetical protein A3G66_01100 [Candidatus Levybacteria bacterium RIFCSPLOWO2_12_FULL_39_17]
MVKLTRAEENPIITPSDLPWEDMLVFNPGAVASDGKILLLYRAKGRMDKVSRFGLAESTDGIPLYREFLALFQGEYQMLHLSFVDTYSPPLKSSGNIFLTTSRGTDA